MRFRSQLLLLVVSTLIPAFLAAAWAVWYVYSEERKEQEMNLQEAARSFAVIVENDLKIREATLRALSNSPLLEMGQLERFYRFAKTTAPMQSSTIILRHASGAQLFNTRRPLGSKLPATSAANFAALAASHGAGDTIVSDLFFAQVAKRWDFALQVPVSHRKHGYAFLNMGVNASELQSVLLQQRFPETWISTIVDRKGVVIARSHSPEQFVGKLASESARKFLATSRNGSFNNVSLDNIPVKAFYSRVPISDWSVVISIPEEEINKTPRQAAAFLGAAMIILLVIAAGAASWLSRRLVRPMEELGVAAQRMADNEEVVYLPHKVDEIDLVRRQIADASAKIRNATQELERRVAETSSKAEKVERALQQSQKMEALGRLTGGIAHEFNNVLQTISSAVQLAKLMPHSDRVLPLMETAGKAIERASALTSQLSAFGRAQEAKLATIRIDEQLASFRELVKGVLPSNIILDMQLAGPSWPVTVDPLQLELAFLNIIINARDAIPAGGSLTVRVENYCLQQASDGLLPGDYVRISIADTGTGMSPEVAARAVEPFFTTKPLGKGTGLGLAQVYGFVRQSHGALVIESVVGQGTTVDILLPRETEVRIEAPGSPDGEALPGRASGTILFVDDDPLVRESIVPALEHAGLQVIAAAAAEQALAMLESGIEVDFVFSDVMMPGKINGMDLAKAVLSKNNAPKVVLATGYSDFETSIPHVKVIAKPYRVSDIIELIRASKA